MVVLNRRQLCFVTSLGHWNSWLLSHRSIEYPIVFSSPDKSECGSNYLGPKSQYPTLVKWFDLHNRCAMVAADPKRARIPRIVDIDAANVGRAGKHVFCILSL